MFSLSTQESAILAVSQHNGLSSVAEIAKKLKMRHHIVRHALDRLIARKVIIGCAPFINLAPLGYTDYTFFLSIHSKREQRKEQLVSELIRTPGVAWVASVGGQYQLAVSILALHAEEAVDIFYRLAEKCQVTILDKALSVRTRFHAFGRKYLSPKYQVPPLIVGPLDAAVALDETDRTILSTLAEARNESMQESASRVKIPASTFIRRVKALHDQGIIQGFVYRLNPSSFGMQQFRLLLFSQGMDAAITGAVRQFARKHPQVTHLFECLGNWDFELVVEVQHPENVNEVSQQLFDQFEGRIRNVRVQQIFKHLKYVGYPFR